MCSDSLSQYTVGQGNKGHRSQDHSEMKFLSDMQSCLLVLVDGKEWMLYLMRLVLESEKEEDGNFLINPYQFSFLGGFCCVLAKVKFS